MVVLVVDAGVVGAGVVGAGGVGCAVVSAGVVVTLAGGAAVVMFDGAAAKIQNLVEPKVSFLNYVATCEAHRKSL